MKKKYVQICCKKKSKQIDNPDNTVITVNGGFEGNLFSNTLMVERGKYIYLLVCWDERISKMKHLQQKKPSKIHFIKSS